MTDFYSVLRKSLDRADAPDEEQRQQIYDHVRTVMIRKLDGHRPRLRDTEFRQRLVDFDAAIVRIEDEIAASFEAADDMVASVGTEEDDAGYDEMPPAVVEEVVPYVDDGADEAELYDDELTALEEEALPPLDEELPVEEYDAPFEEPPAELPPPVWSEPQAAAPDPEDAENGGGAPSPIWGSPAIDLAWDETTAQWHDPEEPSRPTPLPPEPPPRPATEWDRRLEMALAEEQVRRRGAPAAPEWTPPEPEYDDQAEGPSAFFEAGEWDDGGAADGRAMEAFDPPEDRGLRRLGAVTARLRTKLASTRLRLRPERPAKAGRIEPRDDIDDLDDAPPPPRQPERKVRNSTVRSVTLDRAIDAQGETVELTLDRRAPRQAGRTPHIEPRFDPMPDRPAPSRNVEPRLDAIPDRVAPPRVANTTERRDLPPPSRASRPAALRQLPAPAASEPAGDSRRVLAPAGNRAVMYLGADSPSEAAAELDREDMFAPAVAEPAMRPRQQPRQRYAEPPPEPLSRRMFPSRRSVGPRLKIALAVVAVIVIAWAGYVVIPLILPGGGGAGTETTDGNTNADPALDRGIVLFAGTDGAAFAGGAENPAAFDAETAGGIVRIVSSAAGAGRAAIAPDIATRVDGRQVRVTIDVRATPGRPASTMRIAYLRGNTLLEWRTVTVGPDFQIVDAIWEVPSGSGTGTADALLIQPGVTGDSTAVDIRRITMDIGG